MPELMAEVAIVLGCLVAIGVPCCLVLGAILIVRDLVSDPHSRH